MNRKGSFKEAFFKRVEKHNKQLPVHLSGTILFHDESPFLPSSSPPPFYE